MKAYVIRRYGTVNDIEFAEVDSPACGSEDVLVQVKSAAVNPADIKVVTGKNGGRFIHSGKSPIRLGFDFSGIIREVGNGVSGFAPGDAVFGFLPYSMKTTQGSFADFVAVNAGTIALMPPAISFTAAATAATTASTALQSLSDIGGIRTDQKVLVNGASGGVGCYAVQIAKQYGAEVWGSCSEPNLDFVRSLGADHALDYKRRPLHNLTEKFDIILDAVSNSSFGECSGIMTSNSVYITLLPSISFVVGKFRSLFSSRKCAACMVRPRTATLEEIANLLADERISAPVAATFPVSQLKAAFEQLELGGLRGKIGITVKNSDRSGRSQNWGTGNLHHQEDDG